MPGAGVEPARLSSVDFESTASANSATRATKNSCDAIEKSEASRECPAGTRVPRKRSFDALLFRLHRPKRRPDDARLIEKFRRHEPGPGFQTREKFFVFRTHAAADDDEFRPEDALEHAEILVEPAAPFFPSEILALASGGRDGFFIRLSVVRQIAEFARHHDAVVSQHRAHARAEREQQCLARKAAARAEQI